MGWVDPWVGLGWVSQLMGWVGNPGHKNGRMDISALCCDDISTRRTVPEGGGGGGGVCFALLPAGRSVSKTRFETGSSTTFAVPLLPVDGQASSTRACMV